MLKVLIAEDEEWIRKGIIKVVDWDRLGMQLAAEASNGKMALQLIREFEPDIILIDIRMPGMDGLETISNILCEMEKKPKIIIISGYDNFSYAQKAISYGTFAYILKPVKKTELNVTLKKVKELIQYETEIKKQQDSMLKKINDTLPIVKEKLLEDILEGKSSGENAVRENVLSFSPFYIVFVAGVCDFFEFEKTNISSYEFMKQHIIQRIEAALPKSRKCIVYEKRRNCFVIIIGLGAPEENIPCIIAEDILKHFEIDGLCKLTIGVGQAVEGVSNIKLSFENAYCAYREKLVKGGGIIIKRCPKPDNTYIAQERTIKELCLAVEIGNKSGIEQEIEVMINYLNSKELLCFDSLNNAILRIKSQLDYICKHCNFTEKFLEPEDLLYIEGIDSFKRYLYKKLVAISDKILFERENDSTKAVEKAKGFIESHYMENISLDQLAAFVHLNPNYLSEVFKKETGLNFIDYLLIQRIEKAKQLLKNPDISVNRVAELVGYTNPRYFSCVFKKLTGSTPTEFKNIFMGG